MIHLVLVGLFLNAIIALVYAKVLNKAKKTDFLPRFLVAALIPVYGLLIVGLVDLRVKNRGPCLNALIFGEEGESDVQPVDDDAGTVIVKKVLNNMPIDDMLIANDQIDRREMVFEAVTGDYRRLYPFFVKMLKDHDAEVVHYATTAITSNRQRINEQYKVSLERHQKNPYHLIHHLIFLDDFIELIHWEEMSGADTSESRKILQSEFQFLFDSVGAIDEKYYAEKLRNEIKIGQFKEVIKTCNKYLTDFPDSESGFLVRLECWYCCRDFDNFNETLRGWVSGGRTLCSQAEDWLTIGRESANI